MEAHIIGSWEGCQDSVSRGWHGMRGSWEVKLWAKTSQAQGRLKGQQSQKKGQQRTHAGTQTRTPTGLASQGLRTEPSLALNLDLPVSTSLELGFQVDIIKPC